MNRKIVGLLILVLLLGIALPVWAEQTELSEEDESFIAEFWQNRIQLQQQFVEGLKERGLISEERYEQMLSRLQEREEEGWKMPWFDREECCRERHSGRRSFQGMRGHGGGK